MNIEARVVDAVTRVMPDGTEVPGSYVLVFLPEPQCRALCAAKMDRGDANLYAADAAPVANAVAAAIVAHKQGMGE